MPAEPLEPTSIAAQEWHKQALQDTQYGNYTLLRLLAPSRLVPYLQRPTLDASFPRLRLFDFKFPAYLQFRASYPSQESHKLQH